MMRSENDSRELKRINLEIIDRILLALFNYGDERKTFLARKTNTSYDNFICYLQFLESLEFVKRSTKNQSEFISLSNNGRSYCTRKFTK